MPPPSNDEKDYLGILHKGNVSKQTFSMSRLEELFSKKKEKSLTFRSVYRFSKYEYVLCFFFNSSSKFTSLLYKMYFLRCKFLAACFLEGAFQTASIITESWMNKAQWNRNIFPGNNERLIKIYKF